MNLHWTGSDHASPTRVTATGENSKTRSVADMWGPFPIDSVATLIDIVQSDNRLLKGKSS